tara:strand:+ start:3411 stop:3566 length:156 start_codon:yes stop_codon:yes gene_type:complete
MKYEERGGILPDNDQIGDPNFIDGQGTFINGDGGSVLIYPVKGDIKPHPGP